MANVLDSNIISEFELQLRYNIHFRTNTFAKRVSPSYSLNSTTVGFLHAWFGIKLTTNEVPVV